MNRNLLLPILLLTFSFIAVQSCKHGGPTVISSHGSSESHNWGQNCMNCHKQGGEGEGWFKVGGTVYDSLQTNSYPNVTIRLFTGPDGTGALKYTIDGDELGNFYTTEFIDFIAGLYPAVQTNNGVKYMSTTIDNGQCNSCHGVTTERIWAN
jgi:cytochrome c553